MDVALEFGGEPQDLTVTLSGEVTPQELRRMNDELLADPRYTAGLAILVDISGLHSYRLDGEGIDFANASVNERDWYKPPLAIAIYAPDEAARTATRHYIAYVGGSASGRAVFATRDHAVAWLREQRHRPPASAPPTPPSCPC